MRRPHLPPGPLALLLLLAIACTTQGRYVHLGKVYPARPESHPIEVLRVAPADRPFVRVSRVDVHLEKTHFMDSGLEDALPELRRQARLSGADALIEIEERRSSVGETRIYHASAIGIRFIEQ